MQKKEHKRLRILYYIFFSFVTLSVCFSFVSVFLFGNQETSFAKQLSEKVTKKEYKFYIATTLRKGQLHSSFDIPVYSNSDSSIVVSGRVNTFDVLIQEKGSEFGHSKYYTLGMVFAGFTLLGFIAILVLFGILFCSLWKSIKKGRIFSKKDIRYIRIIAILLMSTTIIAKLSIFFEHLEIAYFLSGTEWAPIVEIPIPFFEITFGIVILFISEFFTVGYRLQEDQELTI